MNFTLKSTVTAICALCASAAASADYHVKRSLELSSPAVEVWHLIGDFCDIDDWHPGVSTCSLKTIDGSLVRVLTTVSGNEIVQKRIAEEPGLSYTYKTVSSSLPIENFTATLSIEPFGTPLVMWSGSFSSDDPAMEQIIVEDIETGMSAIEDVLKAR
ncbi:SRPBCC family protein [Roseobacter sp. EG26]|uniref:SRPBCC family protein n=1 Tax=Roseobacter sp. EG26 TaxID=3412477 RepID=UPI003CE5A6F5